MGAMRVVHQAGIGEDHRIDAEGGGLVDRGRPARPVVGERKGIEGDQHLDAALVGVGDALLDAGVVEVEAGEVARVGGVAKAGIDAVGAVIDGDLQRREPAGGTDEFEWGSHGDSMSWRADYKRGASGPA
jgi:hypothetical protein